MDAEGSVPRGRGVSPTQVGNDSRTCGEWARFLRGHRADGSFDEPTGKSVSGRSRTDSTLVAVPTCRQTGRIRRLRSALPGSCHWRWSRAPSPFRAVHHGWDVFSPAHRWAVVGCRCPPKARLEVVHQGRDPEGRRMATRPCRVAEDFLESRPARSRVQAGRTSDLWGRLARECPAQLRRCTPGSQRDGPMAHGDSVEPEVRFGVGLGLASHGGQAGGGFSTSPSRIGRSGGCRQSRTRKSPSSAAERWGTESPRSSLRPDSRWP